MRWSSWIFHTVVDAALIFQILKYRNWWLRESRFSSQLWEELNRLNTKVMSQQKMINGLQSRKGNK